MLSLSSGASALVMLANASISAPVANIDFLTLFSGSYDRYTIEMLGIRLAATDQPMLRLANDGTPDTDLHYSAGISNWGTSEMSKSLPLSTNVRSDGMGAWIAIDVFNANASAGLKSVRVQSLAQTVSSSTWYATQNLFAYTGAVVSGFRIFLANGSNFSAGTIRVYGYKNSI